MTDCESIWSATSARRWWAARHSASLHTLGPTTPSSRLTQSPGGLAPGMAAAAPHLLAGQCYGTLAHCQHAAAQVSSGSSGSTLRRASISSELCTSDMHLVHGMAAGPSRSDRRRKQYNFGGRTLRKKSSSREKGGLMEQGTVASVSHRARGPLRSPPPNRALTGTMSTIFTKARDHFKKLSTTSEPQAELLELQQEHLQNTQPTTSKRAHRQVGIAPYHNHICPTTGPTIRTTPKTARRSISNCELRRNNSSFLEGNFSSLQRRGGLSHNCNNNLYGSLQHHRTAPNYGSRLPPTAGVFGLSPPRALRSLPLVLAARQYYVMELMLHAARREEGHTGPVVHGLDGGDVIGAPIDLTPPPAPSWKRLMPGRTVHALYAFSFIVYTANVLADWLHTWLACHQYTLSFECESWFVLALVICCTCGTILSGVLLVLCIEQAFVERVPWDPFASGCELICEEFTFWLINFNCFRVAFLVLLLEDLPMTIFNFWFISSCRLASSELPFWPLFLSAVTTLISLCWRLVLLYYAYKHFWFFKRVTRRAAEQIPDAEMSTMEELRNTIGLESEPRMRDYDECWPVRFAHKHTIWKHANKEESDRVDAQNQSDQSLSQGLGLPPGRFDDGGRWTATAARQGCSAKSPVLTATLPQTQPQLAGGQTNANQMPYTSQTLPHRHANTNHNQMQNPSVEYQTVALSLTQLDVSDSIDDDFVDENRHVLHHRPHKFAKTCTRFFSTTFHIVILSTSIVFALALITINAIWLASVHNLGGRGSVSVTPELSKLCIVVDETERRLAPVLVPDYVAQQSDPQVYLCVGAMEPGQMDFGFMRKRPQPWKVRRMVGKQLLTMWSDIRFPEKGSIEIAFDWTLRLNVTKCLRREVSGWNLSSSLPTYHFPYFRACKCDFRVTLTDALKCRSAAAIWRKASKGRNFANVVKSNWQSLFLNNEIDLDGKKTDDTHMVVYSRGGAG